ncbi:MAG: isocitrate lyase/PEP mutase family protein [Planctomycetota bacterium]
MTKSLRLRQLLARNQATLLCGAYDGLSARLAAEAGFDAIWASGFCIAASKALPDVGLVTMSEHLSRTAEMVRSVDAPVVVDADDGFGDFVNLTRTVREYEAAGVAALCVEDNQHPKRCSLYADLDRKIVSAEEFADKIKAAKDAQISDDFVFVARTEALVAGRPMSEAIDRGHLYEEAGADVLLVHWTQPGSQAIEEFAAKWTGNIPLAVVPTAIPQASASFLTEHGYRMVVFANQALRSAIETMQLSMRRMVETGSLLSVDDMICTLREVARLVDLDEVRALEKRYAKTGAKPELSVIEAS